MRIDVPSPMAGLRAEAVRAVNAYYNGLAALSIHLEAAHTCKQAIAQAVLNGESPPASFAEEAKLRGITVLQLADIVVAKALDESTRAGTNGALLMARELDRQKVLLEIDAATSIEALRGILASQQLGSPALGIAGSQ